MAEREMREVSIHPFHIFPSLPPLGWPCSRLQHDRRLIYILEPTDKKATHTGLKGAYYSKPSALLALTPPIKITTGPTARLW